MTKTWLISDTHFNWSNAIHKYKRPDGSPVRDFKDLKEMHDILIDNWNSYVSPNDLIFHLGDISMTREGLKVLSQLNGRKKLLRGNHDIWKIKDYTPYFEDVASVKVYPEHKVILSHYPIHPSCLGWAIKYNIHGHTHINDIMRLEPELQNQPDTRYFNICVEKTEYKPILLQDALERIKELQNGNS